MIDEKIKRINELAKLAKERELTPEETAERAQLRAEYIAAYKADLKAQLENIVLQRPDGSREKLKHK